MPAKLTTEELRLYAADPMQFALALTIQTAHAGERLFADVIRPFQRERFAALAPSLLAVVRNEQPTKRRYFWEATKGTSKDGDLAIAVVWLVAFSPRPLTIQVAAADQDQADELRKAAKSLLRLNPWLADLVDCHNWRLSNAATDAVCDIVAADTAGSQGARPDVLIVNELSQVTKAEFVENLMDNSAKMPNGVVIIASNAGFAGTWQDRWRENARTSPLWSFHRYAEPAPWMDPDDLAEAEKRNTRSRFLRLFWGVRASGGGDALEEADIAAAVRKDLLQFVARVRGYGFTAGLDLGIKHDRSALAVLGCHARTQRIQLAHVAAWAPTVATGKVDLLAVETAVMAAWKLFRCPVRYDPFQAELMAQRLRKAGVRMVEIPFVGKNLDRMASDVLDVFRSRRIDLYDEPELIRDLGRLTIVERGYGYKLESTRDADGHADRATALALALLGAPEAMCQPAEAWGGVMENKRRSMYGEPPQTNWARPSPGFHSGQINW